MNLKTAKKIVLIAAVARNNAIGKDNDLLWHLPNDFKRFKSLTSHHTIIMGRKTFESFPKPLPNRVHIVITNQLDYKAPEGVIVVHSLKAALHQCASEAKIYIIGGGTIYAQAMAVATHLEITWVDAHIQADTFFPEIDTSVFEMIENNSHLADAQHAYNYSFTTYQKNKNEADKTL